MITQRVDPTDIISIFPPRDAEADSIARLDRLRDRFARNDGLPFADVLTEARIHDALDEHGVTYRDRVFSPVTTIWGFLSQVLSEDHSCRDAVTRIIAHRAANGLGTCSPNTASYCNARGRLPTGVLRTLAKRTAQELQAGAADQWKGNGRNVLIADGSHVSMPDTPGKSGSGAGARSSSATGGTSACPTRRRPRSSSRSRGRKGRGSASRWLGSWYCCPWRPGLAMIWRSRRTRARAPARRPSCGRCT